MEALQEAELLSLWSLTFTAFGRAEQSTQWWTHKLSVEVWPRICHGLLATSLCSQRCDGTGHSVWALSYF